MNKLVAYFSASGVTAKVAETLADAIGADIHFIEPAVRYTEADLNWRDKNSRSSVEMNDPTSRPAIASLRNNMDVYVSSSSAFRSGGIEPPPSSIPFWKATI